MAIRAGKRPGDAIDLSPQEKKMRASINDAAADLLCPISQELPVDPVIAEDGQIYEAQEPEGSRSKQIVPVAPGAGRSIETW